MTNYIQTAMNEAHEKWSKSIYIEGSKDENQSKILSLLLENQQLFNNNNHKGSKLFKDVSLDIIANVWKNFIGFNWVSVQPMAGPVSLITEKKYNHYKKEFLYETHDCAAKTRHLKTRLPINLTIEQVAPVSKIIRSEIVNEILTDVRNNCSTVKTTEFHPLSESFSEQYEFLYVKLLEINAIVHRKTLRSPCDWMVVGKKFAQIFQCVACFSNEVVDLDKIDETIYLGNISSRWKVFYKPNYPDNEILCGRYEPLGGYVYSPYVFLGELDGLENEVGLITRYGKKLLNKGKDYAKIVFKNL